MTGFGAADGVVGGGRLQVEIRTVNHRFLSVAAKLASDLLPLEAALRERLRQDFDRGHATVHIRWTETPVRANGLQLDPERAREAMARLRELQMAVGLTGDVPLDLLARQPDVFRNREDASDTVTWDAIAPVVDDAVRACKAMRKREGEVLVTELGRRLEELVRYTDQVTEVAPDRMRRERDRLQRSVKELLAGHVLDEGRVAQELALLADKLDVTEEVVRLRAHLDAATGLLSENRAVGKALGFLAQEIGREVNTIGAKANDTTMTHHVIAMKGELEKFREQLENLE